MRTTVLALFCAGTFLIAGLSGQPHRPNVAGYQLPRG